MSVVIGFSFPEEAILVSDSRISFVKGKFVYRQEDNLRKIFALTPQLAIGFVSDDVTLTHKVISKLENYIQESKIRVVYHLLQKLPKVATYEYKKLTKGMKSLPRMEFIYAGILADRPLTVPEPVIMKMMGSGAVPEPIGRALMTMRNGSLTMAPPTPVIMKQTFPSGNVSNFGVYTCGAIGSGASIETVFEKEYSKLLMAEPAPIGTFRSNLIRLICDDFIKESKISSIGGVVQVLRINAAGVSGVDASFKRIFSDSRVVDISSMEFDGEKWTWKNYETGEEGVVESFFPPAKAQSL